MFFISKKFLVISFAALLGINLFWIFLNGSGGNVFFDEFDSVLHGFGGLLIGLMAVRYIVEAKHAEFFTLKRSHYLLAILSFTMLVGVLWEFSEFLSDRLISASAHLRSQPSVDDTMLDLFFDMLGGAVAFFIGLCYKRKS